MILRKRKSVRDKLQGNRFISECVCSLLGWRNFDDEHVSLLSHDKDLVRPDAYVLFYRHRHLTVELGLDDAVPSVNTTSAPMDVSEDSTSMDTAGFDDVIDFFK